MPLICDRCGHPVRTLFYQDDGPERGQGWCKICHQDKKFAGVVLHHTHFSPDEYPGGPITLENYGAKPVEFRAESERVAYMQKHELHLKERWCPFPGTDRDPAGVQNPEGYVDKVTLDNRAELFLRAHGAKKDDSIEGVVGHTFGGVLSHQDAVAVSTGTDPNRQSRVFRRTQKEQDNG